MGLFQWLTGTDYCYFEMPKSCPRCGGKFEQISWWDDWKGTDDVYECTKCSHKFMVEEL